MAGDCIVWSEQEANALFDVYFTTSRAFSMIATVTSFAVMIVTCLVLACVDPSKKFMSISMSCLYVLVGICQGLVLLMYNSSLCNNNGCSAQAGSYYAFSATILYLLCAILFLFFIGQETNDDNDDDAGEETHATTIEQQQQLNDEADDTQLMKDYPSMKMSYEDTAQPARPDDEP